MSSPRGLAVAGLVLAPLLLSSCLDDQPVGPDGLDVAPPAAAVIDGSTGGNPAFYFLPPLVKKPKIVGTFDGSLAPAMRVCELAVNGCAPGAPAAYFPPGSASVSSGQYQIVWDTDGPQTAPLDPAKFYRIEILVAGTVMGALDLDPQHPDGPGQSRAPRGFHAFRLGATIPVKFWLSADALCDADGVVVVECAAQTITDAEGGRLALDDEGDPLSLFIPANALPAGNPVVTVLVERLDPSELSEECIPFLDAPQFGPCFRVTTFPELSGALELDALVSICLDPHAIPAIKGDQHQENQLQIVRYATDGSDEVEALPGTSGDCPVPTAGLFDVPDRGFARYAALGANWVARVVGPEPLLARRLNIRLGGLTSSFSRFRFALPGQMFVTDGGGAVVRQGEPGAVRTFIRVVDSQGIGVQGARLHFATDDGTTDVSEAMTNFEGFASVGWTIATDLGGEKELRVSAVGLLTDPVPDHSHGFTLEVETLTVTAVVLPPSGEGEDESGGETDDGGEEGDGGEIR